MIDLQYSTYREPVSRVHGRLAFSSAVPSLSPSGIGERARLLPNRPLPDTSYSGPIPRTCGRASKRTKGTMTAMIIEVYGAKRGWRMAEHIRQFNLRLFAKSYCKAAVCQW